MKKLIEQRNDLNKKVLDNDKFYYGIRENKIVKLNKRLWNSNNIHNNCKDRSLSIISFNSNGVKRNVNFVQYLCQYDIIYLCETWLHLKESLDYLNNLSTNHNFIHNSDMSIHPFKGRPLGGRSFIINKRIKVIKYEFINRYLATLSCNDNSNIISLISCYFPYDNGTHLNFS